MLLIDFPNAKPFNQSSTCLTSICC